jgi:uncharacterized membrane protein YcjF (UPF0283 family)
MGWPPDCPKRLGEGVINGLLTARIGIAAMDLCRPLAFRAVKSVPESATSSVI